MMPDIHMQVDFVMQHFRAMGATGAQLAWEYLRLYCDSGYRDDWFLFLTRRTQHG